MHLCERKAFVGAQGVAFLPVSPELLHGVPYSLSLWESALLHPPGPRLGSWSFHQGAGVWCQEPGGSTRAWLCNLHGDCAPQFPHQKHAHSYTAPKGDGMRWFLWSSCPPVSWREEGWFPWELPSEAWKAHQLQRWVGAPLCPRHHVANP